MTVTSTPRRTGTLYGNDVTTAFPFTFKVFAKSDVQVLVKSTAGVITTAVLNSDYSITLNADQSTAPGGTITYPISGSPLPTGASLVALGALPYDQTLSLPSGGNFNAASIEQALDREEMQIQQIAAALAATVQVPAGEVLATLPSAALRASRVLAFDSSGQPIIIAGVDSGSAAALAIDLASTATGKGAALIGFSQGAGALATTALAKLRQLPSDSDYSTFAGYSAANPLVSIWSDYGGRVHRMPDRLLIGTAAGNDGKKNPSVTDWIGSSSFRNGIYQYLLNNAALAVGANGTNLAITGYGRSSGGAGTAGEGTVGVSGMAHNDYEMINAGLITCSGGVLTPALVSSVGVQGTFYTCLTSDSSTLASPVNGITTLPPNSQIRFHNGQWRTGAIGSGVWGLYSTVVRKSANVFGPTHAIETDIANLGNTVALFPASIFGSGSTTNLWVCSGGEATISGGSAVGVASAALCIVSNDPATTGLTTGARFEKGIVFHNLSLYGTDGSTGEADWLAISPGMRQSVFNNSGVVVSRTITTNTDGTKSQRMDFSAFGWIMCDDTSGATHFQIQHTASAANYLSVKPQIATAAPEIVAAGTDTNIDIVLRPKGVGTLSLFCGAQTTVGASGAASALPANPVGYAKLVLNGSLRAVPYYNI